MQKKLNNYFMLQEFFLKKMIDAKLKDVPEKEREMIVKLFLKNPDLFKKIAEEAEAEMKMSGKSAMETIPHIMQKYAGDLEQLKKEVEK